MKKRTILILVAVLIVGLFGCSQMRTKLDNCTPWETENSFGMTYSRFDGSREYPLKLDTPSAIAVDVHTDGGILKVEIAAAGEDPIYSGTMAEDFSFTVNAQSGEYTVHLTGDNHAGRVELKWKSAEADVPDAS